MPRLTIFAKGNIDLRDTLHAYRRGGVLEWNGINDIVRARYSGWTVRLRHETFTRSDALLSATGLVPPSLAKTSIDFGPYPATSQFSAAIFDPGADVAILSIQPDVALTMARHRERGYLLYPNRIDEWTAAERSWLRRCFTPTGILTVAESMENFAGIVLRLKAASVRHVLVYNLSSVVPGDEIHCHRGLADALSTRIRRFNLALTELSDRAGVSIVDVDTILARAGADRLKLDAWRLNADGCRLVAEETVRVLADLGCFGEDAR